MATLFVIYGKIPRYSLTCQFNKIQILLSTTNWCNSLKVFHNFRFLTYISLNFWKQKTKQINLAAFAVVLVWNVKLAHMLFKLNTNLVIYFIQLHQPESVLRFWIYDCYFETILLEMQSKNFCTLNLRFPPTNNAHQREVISSPNIFHTL